jgi:hypothetical protein
MGPWSSFGFFPDLALLIIVLCVTAHWNEVLRPLCLYDSNNSPDSTRTDMPNLEITTSMRSSCAMYPKWIYLLSSLMLR